MRREKIELYLKEIIGKIGNVDASKIDITADFFDLGIDSKTAMKVVKQLEEKINDKLYPTLLFEYQTVEELAGYLEENYAAAFSA